MKRLTTDTPKTNLENALNLFYAKDGETWVRGGGHAPEYQDVSLFDYVRQIIKAHVPDMDVDMDNEYLSEMLFEWLFDGADSIYGVIATLYTAAWAFAEIRERLKAYEDILGGEYDLARLRELAQADKEGRLVVLPKDARQTSTPDDDLVTLVRPGGDLSVKPCPFCGGNNVVYWQYKHPHGLRWRIACLDCMAMIDPGWIQQHDYLANMWNKRADAHEEAEAALKGGDNHA